MTTAARQAYLDRVRGLAVLIMIEAHVLDSWTRVADRSHPGFGYAMILGGFGAPLFLFLAGVAVVLSAESKFRKTGDFSSAWRAVQNRGWQVFGLAFLFRLQSYILSGGYSAISLLKVDILNVMGPAIAMAAIAGGTVKTQTRACCPVRCCDGGDSHADACCANDASFELVARSRLSGTSGLSPGGPISRSFPGPGFVFAGALVGIFIDGLRAADRAVRRQIALATAAILLAFLAYGASFLPSIYARSEFWTSSPAYFFLRVGILTLLLPLAFFWDAGSLARESQPLESFRDVWPGIPVRLLGPRGNGLWVLEPDLFVRA